MYKLLLLAAVSLCGFLETAATDVECTVGMDGALSTFDNAEKQLTGALVSKSFVMTHRKIGAENDRCAVNVYISRDSTGVDKVRMNLIRDRVTGGFSMRIDMKSNPFSVTEIRSDTGKRELTSILPYDSADFPVRVQLDGSGWKLTNTECNYHVVYHPSGPTPELAVTLPELYHLKTEGLCENNDGNPTNDRTSCYIVGVDCTLLGITPIPVTSGGSQGGSQGGSGTTAGSSGSSGGGTTAGSSGGGTTAGSSGGNSNGGSTTAGSSGGNSNGGNTTLAHAGSTTTSGGGSCGSGARIQFFTAMSLLMALVLV